MSDTGIRDDRAAGRPEAVGDGEEVGRIEYFVLESPGREGEWPAAHPGRF